MNWAELVGVEDAARDLGLEPKRLRGFIARNSLWDPIGNMHQVYAGSLTHLRERLSVLRSVGRIT